MISSADVNKVFDDEIKRHGANHPIPFQRFVEVLNVKAKTLDSIQLQNLLIIFEKQKKIKVINGNPPLYLRIQGVTNV